MENIKIYSTPTCHYCQKAKELFNEHNIAYEECNVKDDPVSRAEMIECSGQMSVPVIVIGDDTFIGYNETMIKQRLNID
jgi:glutaredoxin 3